MKRATNHFRRLACHIRNNKADKLKADQSRFTQASRLDIRAEAADGITEGDEVQVDLSTGLIRNLTTGADYEAEPLPAFMQELVAAGGLLPYLKARAGVG